MLEQPVAPARTPDPVIHDRMVEQLEETLPDGTSPKGPGSRVAARFLFAFGALALGGMVIFLFIRGGWAAGAAGLGILFLYAFMGSTPWFAGAFRARDHREVELVIDRELNGHPPAEPRRTA